MFGLSWSEMLVVAVVAIVVVGPKDLPALMRTVGQWVGKAKRMGRDFQRQLDDVLRDDELTKLQRQVAELGRQRSPAPPAAVAIQKDAGPADTRPMTEATP